MYLEKRISQYKKLHCKSQRKLYGSFIDYGTENHVFEIILECDISEMNDKERYYQDLFDCVDSGLNCRLTTSRCKSGKVSDSTRKKMSDYQKTKTMSDEAKRKMSEARRNISDETRFKMSEAGKKRRNTESQKAKISKSLSKVVLNTETGIYYDSINEASLLLGINRNSLSGYLNGHRTNNTNLIKV